MRARFIAWSLTNCVCARTRVLSKLSSREKTNARLLTTTATTTAAAAATAVAELKSKA